MANDTKLRLILEAIWKGSGVKQASSDLDKLTKSTGTAGGSLKKAGLIAGVMGGVMATVSSKIMQGVGAMKDMAVESVMLAARYETMGTVVDRLGANIGHSTSQMRMFEKSLQETGISMIGSREAIASLIAADIDLANATDLARVAQDGAVIANTNSTDAYQRLIQFISTGNVRVARSMNLFIDLAGGYKKWAEANDRTVASLTEVEKASIRANLAIEAGATIAGTYEAAMTTLAKQLGSLTGRELPDLKTALGEVAQGPLFDVIVGTRELIGAFTDQIVVQQELADRLADGTITTEEYNWALEKLYDTTEVAAEAIEFAAAATDRYTERMVEANSVVDGWVAAQGLLGEGLEETGEQLSDAEQEWADWRAEIEATPERKDVKVVTTFSSTSDIAGLADKYERLIIGGEELGNIQVIMEAAIAGGARGAEVLTMLAEQETAELAVDVLVGDTTALDAAEKLAADFNISETHAKEMIDAWVAKLASEGPSALQTMKERAIALGEGLEHPQGIMQDILDNYAALQDKTITLTINAVGSGATQYAHGGRLPARGLAEVGELGPEFVLDGVVIPASLTKKMKQLGIGASQGFAQEASAVGGGGGGGPRRRGDAGSGDANDVSRRLAQDVRLGRGTSNGGSSLPAAGAAIVQAAAETAGAVEELARTIPAAVAAQQEALLMQQRQQLSQQLAQGAEQVQTLLEILLAIRDQGNVEDQAQAVSEAIEGVMG